MSLIYVIEFQKHNFKKTIFNSRNANSKKVFYGQQKNGNVFDIDVSMDFYLAGMNGGYNMYTHIGTYQSTLSFKQRHINIKTIFFVGEKPKNI